MKQHRIPCIVPLGLALVLSSPVFGQEIPADQAEQVIRELQQSHIDANVPAEADFDRLLRRDLVAYFTSSDNDPPEVSYELLRRGPTQTGVAYPKYYVWVQVRRNGQPVREGAARLAAIDRQRFEILQFIERPEISRNPSQLEEVFPPQVVAAIKARIAKTAR